MTKKDETPAALGGGGWQTRAEPLAEELGSIWARCGIDTEWRPLRAVLLHRPGDELSADADPDALLMLERLDPARAQEQHDGLAEAYRAAGVRVSYVEPAGTPPPNQMFCADLLLMTPEGAIVGRPASPVRAGEERNVARRLAALGVPILRTLRGRGTFEGADAAWIAPRTVLLARGLRTNAEGAAQVAAQLAELGVETIHTTLPPATMHLMGQLRFLDERTALAWPGRLPADARRALEEHGFTVHFLPDEEELNRGMAMNLVTVAPRHVVLPAGNPRTLAFLEGLGVRCDAVVVSELVKAAGAVGCLTGVLERDSVA